MLHPFFQAASSATHLLLGNGSKLEYPRLDEGENRRKRPKSANPWAKFDQTQNSMATAPSERREQHPLPSPSAWCDGAQRQHYGLQGEKVWPRNDGLTQKHPIPEMANWGSFYTPVSSGYTQFQKPHFGMVYYWAYLITLAKRLDQKRDLHGVSAPDLERGPTKHGLLDDQPVWALNRMYLFGFWETTIETTGSLGPHKWDWISKHGGLLNKHP